MGKNDVQNPHDPVVRINPIPDQDVDDRRGHVVIKGHNRELCKNG